MHKHVGNFISWTSVLIVFLSLFTANPVLVFIAIVVAAIMDLFDGKMARKYGENTKYNQVFGELTDSLCDIFNFGIAPSLLLGYLAHLNDYNLFYLIVAFIFTWAGIYRLARFSALKDQPVISYYTGLPITIAGPLLALFTILITNQLVIIIITCGLAYLMVSQLKIKKIVF